MVRTQLQIDEDTYEALRTAAHKQRKSMSALVRQMLKEHLPAPEKGEPARPVDIKEKYSWIGAGKSGERDISVRHDDYFSEDYL